MKKIFEVGTTKELQFRILTWVLIIIVNILLGMRCNSKIFLFKCIW